MVAHKLLFRIAFLVIITTLFTSAIDAACVCQEKGTDHCSSCSERLVVRPKQRNYGNGDVGLPPIGDKCYCTKKMIEPATLPKSLGCSSKSGKTSSASSSSCGCCKSSSSSSSSSSYDSVPSIFTSSPSSYAVPQVNYVSNKAEDDSPPADPISVSLAIQAGQAIEVPEAKLAYGFVQKPIDRLPKVYISAVQEENLYALKNDVIILKKKSSPNNVQKYEEEYPEPEDYETDNSDANDDDLPGLTYKQIGYVVEKFRNPTFREVESSYVSSVDSNRGGYNEPSVVRDKVAVDCGYKPGRIAPFRKLPTRSDFESCFENA